MSERFTNHQMTFAGQIDVLSALKRKALNPTDESRVVVVMPPGGQQGVFLTGASQAIHEARLTSGIDAIVSASAGAGTGYFLISGQEEAGDIFHKRNTKNQMIKPGRVPLLDIRTLATMFRDEYPIDIEAFRQNRTRLLVGLTSARTGEEVMIDAGNLENPLSAVVATMLVPFVAGFRPPVVKINGEKYYDGGITNPVAINRALEQNPTHILFLSPGPLDYRIPENKTVTKAIDWLCQRGALPDVVSILAHFPEKFNRGYAELLKFMEGSGEINGVKIAAIAPTYFIDPLSMKKDELYKAQENSRLFTHQMLAAAQ